ncbi:hypothetical protein IKG41_00585 [Candidatus Saccharibacteria bacterium]|nr:hypothetical protein [Candidatus Saccharibacteria bacterium]
MSAEELLRNSELSATSGNEFVANISKTKNKKKGITKKIASFGAMAFLTIAILFFALFFGLGNLIPSTISERLVEETDVQYADAVESKKIVFQQALYNGEIPEDTAKILSKNGVLVGYIDGDEFIESNQTDGQLVLKINDQIITADNFISEINSNIELYNAFNNATYSRAAYYYDDAAMDVFRKIGTNRNNYTDKSDFNDVMMEKIGNGNNINVNNAEIVEKTKINENTLEVETYYDYETRGEATNTSSGAESFISNVANKNSATTSEVATLNAADSLKVADTISKEQRSSLFYLLFMENISKMKAGDGNDSKINEAMNYLYKTSESEVVDVETGEIVKVSGTALDSPSLYALLSGNKVNTEAVKNYSSDRVLKTVENQIGISDSGSVSTTVASTSSNIKGSIGRLINNGNNVASVDILNKVTPTISNSLINNSYDSINGINAGEFLVEGAINVGKELAKASGGTAGDAETISEYARLNSNILAMDAKADRLNRSPFDITSKNTFLGSIFYNFALSIRDFGGDSIISSAKVFSSSVGRAFSSLLPSSFAEGDKGYLTSFGDCETIGSIGAVGSSQCSEIVTFDTTTLNNPFNDPGFISFIENNTSLDASGTRTINKNSKLADFIIYNNERITPIGVMDGGILNTISNRSSSIGFMPDILTMITGFANSSENNKRIASGASFVNSNNNPEWDTYKYAQRYVSLARATAALKKYSNDSTAYNSIKYFEGTNNPVIAFIDEYYNIAKYSQH